MGDSLMVAYADYLDRMFDASMDLTYVEPPYEADDCTLREWLMYDDEVL